MKFNIDGWKATVVVGFAMFGASQLVINIIKLLTVHP